MKARIPAASLLALLSFGAGEALADPVAASHPIGKDAIFELSLRSGDVEIRAKKGKELRMEVEGAVSALSFQGKDRVRALFDGRSKLLHGDVLVELPPGTGVAVESISGDVRVVGPLGEVDIEVVSGDVELDQVDDLRATLVSGDLRVTRPRGEVRARTVSGSAIIDGGKRADSQLEFESTSGDLSWTGRCGKQCEMQVNTLSGDARLYFDVSSSFGLSFSSLSGELYDELMDARTHSRRAKLRYGGGAGSVECNSYSGEVHLLKKSKAKKKSKVGPKTGAKRKEKIQTKSKKRKSK